MARPKQAYLHMGEGYVVAIRNTPPLVVPCVKRLFAHPFLYLKSNPQSKQWTSLLKKGRGNPRSKIEMANALRENLGLDTSMELQFGHFNSLRI